MKILAEGLGFPEGPVWLSDGSVLLVEISAGLLTRLRPDGTRQVVASPGASPNGAAIGPDGACYICNSGGFEWLKHADGSVRPGPQPADYSGGRIERVDLATGELTVLYRNSDKAPLKGPNDLVFDSEGGFWFTDSGKRRSREQDFGAVCYARIDGSECREMIHPLMTPNGIGLSPDGSVLYVAETPTCRLWSFDIARPGQLAGTPRSPAPHGGRLLAGLPGYQFFDSLAVEAGGNICVATLLNGGITVLSPDGELVEHVPLPDPYTTNLCFGGAEMRTAWVTLGTTGRLVEMPWPRPGLRLHASS
ncbi:SMP-30/gluconolactonase/LRE family protein [Variovorax rhizosphaerae]|uniref:SMP-30/gluconolactonase/LRE family protein n=1 Tax=Variovorax rhizosphaerae TaxID=1836200 RepID=A0ABU8WT65_9BURK